MRPLVLALALALPAAACARAEPPPNVLLVVVDTLRADRVGVFGAARALTPHIDALAREGLWYPRAQSPRAKTTPAVATLLTGRYPHEHGVRDLTTPLADDVPTLAEHLRAAGWATGAIVGNYVLRDELSGLARGFDLWVEDLPDEVGVPPHEVAQRRARSLTDGALCALGLGPPSADGAGPRAPLVDGQRPWFLYLHYMDPHGAYDPPAEHRVQRRERPEPIPRQPPADARHERWIAEYNVLPEDRLSDGRVDAALVRDRYDGEVRYVDAELGRLFDALRAEGLLEHTLVVVTSDHGESLGEHEYYFEHGRYAYQASCRVPLALRFPERMRDRPAPGPRGANASLADLAPTLCELLRLPPLGGARGDGADAAPGGSDVALRGRSLAPTFERRPDAPRAVLSEKVERAGLSGAVQSKAVVLGDWKLIQRFAHVPDGDAPDGERAALLGEELYELGADPHEERELSADPPADAPLAELRALLAAALAADPDFAALARRLDARREHLRQTDPDTLRALESLGY